MEQSEFERRKRHLEAELEAGLELLRAGFRAQIRALEQLWLASPAHVASFPGSRLRTPVPKRPPRLRTSRRRARLPCSVGNAGPPGELYDQVLSLLDQLPEVFDRKDLLSLLGAKPKRSTLHNVLEELRREGVLDKLPRGIGAAPVRYRRLHGVATRHPEA